jgi:hypothetical protein
MLHWDFFPKTPQASLFGNGLVKVRRREYDGAAAKD